MLSKFSAMSARPLTRPDAFTLETVPSMIAPSYCDGLIVVIENRSSAFALRVLRALSSVATSRVPSGMSKSPALESVRDECAPSVDVDIPLGLVRRFSVEAVHRHRLTERVILNAARHPHVAAVVDRLEGNGVVASSIAGGRHHQLITIQRGASLHGPAAGALLSAHLAVGFEGDLPSPRRRHGDVVPITVDGDRLGCIQPVHEAPGGRLPLIGRQRASRLLHRLVRIIALAAFQLVGSGEALI